MLELFGPSDLQDLASATGLFVVSAAVLPLVVATINEAFSNYANATAIQIDNSPASERRDWCAGLAKGAADLHGALGHTEHSLFFEKSAFNAAEILKKGWPSDLRSPEAQQLRRQLVDALEFALPEKAALAEGAGDNADIDSHMLVLLGRLGPALQAVSLLARAAQDAWEAEVAKSRGSRELGRRYLMDRAVSAYACLFGHPPAAAPGSAGFRWISALITHAGRVAGEQRRLPGHDELEEEQARVAALQAVEAIAAHIAPLPYKTQTQGTAKLDHWIRQALASPDIQGTQAMADALPLP